MVMPDGHSKRILDRYDLLDPLGRGGMGVVWLAQDALLQRRVAIKEVNVPADVAADEAEAMRARVMREARAAARLNHPHVTTIYDVAREDSRTWIVMEYVDAPTLHAVVERDGPLSPGRAAEVGLAVLGALEAAHAQGIIHRDVKPGNVMVPDEGNVKLADFGVAAVQGDPKITMTGLIVGSPSYMSPEQAQEGRVSEATDMWGLGATLYYAVEGAPAFDRGAAIPTLAAVAHEPPRLAARAGPLAPLLLRLLSKDPSQRPVAGEVRRMLQEVADASGAAGAPTVAIASGAGEADESFEESGWAAESEPPQRRRSTWPVLLAVVVLLALAWFGLARSPGGDQEPRARERRDTTQEEGGGQPAPQQEEPAADEEEDDATATENQDAESDAETNTAADAPAEWVPYEIDDTGSTVAHPPDWSVQQRDAVTADITDPQGGRYLRVQYTDTPKDDAVADWQQQSDAFGETHDDYTEIGIEPYDYPGADTAALWEYTYTEGGAQLHAYNLAVVTGGRGYALNFQTREDQWESSQELWEQFVAGFDPAE